LTPVLRRRNSSWPPARPLNEPRPLDPCSVGRRQQGHVERDPHPRDLERAPAAVRVMVNAELRESEHALALLDL
jgi:hypothetical protein